MSLLRLFIAIETPAEIKAQIAVLQEKLQNSNADVRWEPAEKLHTTLEFLGDVKTDLLPEIVSYLERACRQYSCLELKYTGTGYFPDRRHPKVVWAGVQGLLGNITNLQKTIHDGTSQLTSQPDGNKFHPHVTLGRVRTIRNLNSLLTIMESTTFESQPVKIPEVVLVRSELHPDGSRYSVLGRFPLLS